MLDKSWAETNDNNRRDAIRRRVRRKAAVEINDGWWTLPANVTEMSLDGVRVELERPHVAPDYFTLVMDGKRYRCRSIWQDGRIIGAQFAPAG